jgi:uncharacterized BrkB/YihY/UPF0761 family membrane protein
MQNIKDLSLNGYHTTSVFLQRSLIFVLTPAEQFTKWEKLILPFDSETWIYTIIVFVLTFLITFVINRVPRKIRNLFLGSSERYPAFNILGTFFGVSQVKEPNGNFGRIILMFFVLFCLIIRTAYQGKIK